MNPATETFLNLAREFCAWVESAPLSPEEEAHAAIQHISRVYAAALELKLEDPEGDAAAPQRSQEEWEGVFQRFRSLPFGYYWHHFSPTRIEENEASVGDVADDLTDIYFDLREGLYLCGIGCEANAEWTWRFSFNGHWGRHASSALYALHAYREGHGLFE